MKISEEDLLILAETYHIQSYDKTSSLFRFCRELIKLAQEVEPLKWNLNGTNHWSAMTAANRYGIRRDYEKHTLYIDGFAESEHNSSGEAKEAAQQDYAKRVKSGLKYGGGE